MYLSAFSKYIYFIRKVFLDALFRTGTGDSVEVVVELIMHKRLSEKEQKLAYLSFANAKHVTAPSLNAVAVSP